MKLLAILCLAGMSAIAADVSGVKNVYLLPMSGSLDQYLASRLARDGNIHVVTDPKKADAIFTDRIGANFEETLKNMFEPPPPQSGSGKLEDIQFQHATMAPLSRGKGSLFLVDRGSREVIWSVYVKAKSTNADDMNELAGKIVEQLDKSRKSK